MTLKSIINFAEWQAGVSYLCDIDPVLKQLIYQYGAERLIPTHRNPLETLVRAIVGQQISVLAADKIWQRFQAGLGRIDPEIILMFTDSDLRQYGLSRSKAMYIINVAHYFQMHAITASDFDHMTPDAVMRQLGQIKGVGPWTIEMFMIFYIGYPDILPLTDLGVLNAIKIQYADAPPERSELMCWIEQQSEKWRPYRTIATWYLWRSIDSEVVAY
jgi:DNA-3-methyladenine glycosylase II